MNVSKLEMQITLNKILNNKHICNFFLILLFITVKYLQLF